MTEQAFMRALMPALVAALPIRIWRQNAGKFETTRGHWVEGAPKGAADLVGLVIAGQHKGRHLEIEVKGPKGRQTDEQRNWERRIREFGGIYVVAQDDGSPAAVSRAVEAVASAIR